jgi:hypothetical protein
LPWLTQTGSLLDARSTLYQSHGFPRGIPARHRRYAGNEGKVPN